MEAVAARAIAEAAQDRLSLRLKDLFGATLLENGQRDALRSSRGPVAARLRENELLVTIEALQRDLTRQQRDASHSISNARFMQVSS